MRYPINETEDGVAKAIMSHYHKESVDNFLGGGSSLVLATAIVEIYEVTDVEA